MAQRRSKVIKRTLDMLRFLFAVGFCLISTGLAASTFELSDPANEIYEEKYGAAKPWKEQPAEDEPLCVMESDLERCWCFDRLTGDQVEMALEECRERAEKSSYGEER